MPLMLSFNGQAVCPVGFHAPTDKNMTPEWFEPPALFWRLQDAQIYAKMHPPNSKRFTKSKNDA
jgi:hypothetical protein